MCELVDISMEGRCIKVADIKKAYIENIMKCAPLGYRYLREISEKQNV